MLLTFLKLIGRRCQWMNQRTHTHTVIQSDCINSVVDLEIFMEVSIVSYTGKHWFTYSVHYTLFIRIYIDRHCAMNLNGKYGVKHACVLIVRQMYRPEHVYQIVAYTFFFLTLSRFYMIKREIKLNWTKIWIVIESMCQTEPKMENTVNDRLMDFVYAIAWMSLCVFCILYYVRYAWCFHRFEGQLTNQR